MNNQYIFYVVQTGSFRTIDYTRTGRLDRSLGATATATGPGEVRNQRGRSAGGQLRAAALSFGLLPQFLWSAEDISRRHLESLGRIQAWALLRS